MENLSLILKVIILIILFLILIFPDKYGSKKFKPKTIRIVAGIGIVFYLISFSLMFFSKSKKEEPNLKAQNELESKLTKKISSFSETAKANPWSIKCMEENVKSILIQTPQFPKTTADLIAKNVCACMYEKLKDHPSFTKSMESIKAGSDFQLAMNNSFSNGEEVAKIVNPCSEM